MLHATRWRGICLLAVLAMVAVLVGPLSVRAAGGTGVADHSGLTTGQRAVLYSIARQTWKFYSADVDRNTHLPMDNIGLNGAPAKGTYTSAANIGVYLWAVVAANDL